MNAASARGRLRSAGTPHRPVGVRGRLERRNGPWPLAVGCCLLFPLVGYIWSTTALRKQRAR